MSLYMWEFILDASKNRFENLDKHCDVFNCVQLIDYNCKEYLFNYDPESPNLTSKYKLMEYTKSTAEVLVDFFKTSTKNITIVY